MNILLAAINKYGGDAVYARMNGKPLSQIGAEAMAARNVLER